MTDSTVTSDVNTASHIGDLYIQMSQAERQRLTTIIEIAGDYGYDLQPSKNGLNNLRLAAVTKSATTFCDKASLMNQSAGDLEAWKVLALVAKTGVTLACYEASRTRDPRIITNKPNYVVEALDMQAQLTIQASLVPLKTRRAFANALRNALDSLKKNDTYITRIVDDYRLPRTSYILDLITHATFDGILIAIEYLINERDTRKSQ